ncbi:SLF1 protein, partial [Sagittarius serpentarius]|nr:SLF1 protein [Sagittarius serpentarius]
CFLGKWILTKEYIINSAESGRWLDETTYEWGYEIKKDTHYSPQMQSAPKRWREELTHSGAPGAFHRWKVVLSLKEDDKRTASIRRVLQAGNATMCSSQNAECDITHIFINNTDFPKQTKKCLSEARYYPLQYLGDYLLENEIQNTEDTQMNHVLAVQETDQVKSNMQLAEVKHAVIKHMYFAVVKGTCKRNPKFPFCHRRTENTLYFLMWLSGLNLVKLSLHSNHISKKQRITGKMGTKIACIIFLLVFYHPSLALTNKLKTGSPVPPYLACNVKGLTLSQNSFVSVYSPKNASMLPFLLVPEFSRDTSFNHNIERRMLVRSPVVKSTGPSRGTRHMLEGLMEEYLFPDVIIELAAGQKYFTPPVQFLCSLLEYVLLGNTDAILCAKLHQILYLVLELDPPWKSPSMLKYYLDLLQCPICKKGTWSLLEMLVRSCLHYKTICHADPVSGRGDEQRIGHKRLLKFFFDLVKAEVEFLTKSLVEGTNSQHQQVMPETVLLKTFWLGSKTSVLFSKHVNILADWVIISRRELNRKNDAFRCEIAGLLNEILGTVVEYWVISSLFMDRNVFHQIAGDLAQYLAISCDDFSICELKMFICSIPSLWLQMFVAEAVFKKMCLQRNVPISTEPLSLQKIVCSYSWALQEVGRHGTRKTHEAKNKKIGQWPCPESQKALLMLNGDKQNQAKVLPDLPKCPPLTMKLRSKAEVQPAHTKDSGCLLAEEVHFYRRNHKGQTALHKACVSNKVERLIQLLSSPGTDINAKDYAGWTPLHEACNHGSTVCVREILQRCPEVDLLSQVDGVTPLHDALSNGHVEIGKLLLQHGGPVLLQQRDSNGKLPLDYVESIPVKEELLNVVHPEENIESFCERTEQEFCSQQTELWLTLFSKMLLNFCSVYNLSSPFTSTLRKLACSDVLPVMAYDTCEMKNTFSEDWLVDTYFRELETFQKLPQFLQEISANMFFYAGEQMNALLAALETMVEASQLF